MERLEKTILHLNGTSYSYFRPISTRKIPLQSGSNRGVMPSLKRHLNKPILDYESQLEHDFLLLLDHDPNCIDLQTQPIGIEYKTIKGRKATLYPDCWAIFSDENEFLFEVKSENQLQKMQEDKNWKVKLTAIQNFCKKRGWTYQIVTETKIRCVRLNNIKDLLASAKHYAPSKLRKDIGKFNSSLESFLKSGKKTFKELVELMKVVLTNLKVEEIISLLKYKIYYLDVFIDWNKPLEETELSLFGKIPICVFDLPINPLSQENSSAVIIQEDEEKTKVLSQKDRQKFEERLKLILPIINKFGKEGKRSNVKKHCDDHNLRFEKVYKLYLKWRKEGEGGLIPKRVRQHSKSHLDPSVEKLLQETIYNWNIGEWQQSKVVYEEFQKKCQKLGLKPASYETFRKRIHKLPAVEKRGKFKPSTQTFIERGLSGTYQEGRYPCCVIQMDHTPLDIWLVDSFSKKPLGKPWMTLGVDVYSRSIWGFFLSFNPPTQETVTQAILNGLVPKNQLKDWKNLEADLLKDGINPDYYEIPSAGFPARIQVDNSKDFGAKSVKDLCMDLNITLEFRPVKTPEYGGFIESIWDTINDAIRGAKLAGRVFSLPKSRQSVKRPKFKIPPNYNAKKEAKYTLDWFRNWLFAYFVIKYSTDLKSRQNYSPNERWMDGMRGKNYLPMGGALRLIDSSEYQKLEFKSKINQNSTLSQKGLRYKNILYTSKWLIKARKDGILKDERKYDFKVSHWDIRRIQMINPATQEIETLEAYNYDGDDIITQFILKGLGKVAGFKSFRISLKMIEDVKKRIGTSKFDTIESSIVLSTITDDLRKKAKRTVKERKFLDELSKTKEGRQKLSQAEIITQMDEKPIPTVIDEPDDLHTFEEDEGEEEVEAYPTDFDEIRGDMELGFLFKKDKKGEESDD